MRVLSLFDGISCGRVALERAGVNVESYLASEIEKNAIKVAQHNYPETQQLGDACNIDFQTIRKIDLLMAGTPCQDMSIAMKNREGIEGEKSKLFFVYLEALEKLKPQYFFLENVGSMSKEDRDIITVLHFSTNGLLHQPSNHCLKH